ncbi:MAG: hypothetical protein RSF81_08535 [Oscillospiraceae bacterium]
MSDTFKELNDICFGDNVIRMRDSFKYSKDDINEKIDNLKLSKACMSGTINDLTKLKTVIEFVYSQYIFHLDEWENECGYHGWDWSQDDGRMKNQAEITNGIIEKFQEIYALILSGLGERCE